jgi:hypothetical protein
MLDQAPNLLQREAQAIQVNGATTTSTPRIHALYPNLAPGKYSMMQCDSCPKKLFVKLVLSGLPSGWTCGICLVHSLSLLFNLFDDSCIMTEGAMLCWDKFLHLLPKRMVLFS